MNGFEQGRDRDLVTAELKRGEAVEAALKAAYVREDAVDPKDVAMTVMNNSNFCLRRAP